jgi:hypothetical protein
LVTDIAESPKLSSMLEFFKNKIRLCWHASKHSLIFCPNSTLLIPDKGIPLTRPGTDESVGVWDTHSLLEGPVWYETCFLSRGGHWVWFPVCFRLHKGFEKGI